MLPPQPIQATASAENLPLVLALSSNGTVDVAEFDLFVTVRANPRGPGDPFSNVGLYLPFYAVAWVDENGREDSRLVIPKKEINPPIRVSPPVAGTQSEVTFKIPATTPVMRERLAELALGIAPGVSTPYRCQLTLWYEDDNFNSLVTSVQVPIQVLKK